MAVVLLTGAAGFIGQHVFQRLKTAGAEVVALDAFEPRSHPDGPADWFENERIYPLTIAQWRTARAPTVDTVVHLAAQVSVADSAVDPARYIEQNSRDTALFLKALDPAVTKRLVVASSMSVYGEGGVGVTERAPVCPASVYGLTKYDQERLCLIWGQQHGIPVVALRFFNIYGPGQALTNPYTGVLANFARQLLAGERPTVYEDGQQTRDFVYVEDVAESVVRCALTPVPGGVYNICTGVPTTIERAARTLAAALGCPEVEPDITHRTQPGDIRHCTGSPEKAFDVFGWRASWSFERGIERYAEYLSRASLPKE